jgi:MFS family permease
MLTIAWSLYWAAFTSAWFYAAPLFEQRGASDIVLGFALGGGMLVGAGLSWAGGHVADRVPLTLSVGLTSLIAAVGLLLGPALPGLVMPVLVLLVVAGAPELVYVTLSTYLQHNTRSEFRATSMSIAEGFFSIQMLWLFPLVGYLNSHQGWTFGYTVCAVMSLVAAALFIASQRLAGLEPAGEHEPVAA